MYATGDYARLLPDGTFGILGRRDGQVKIRGNRVELTDVEMCISGIRGVEQVSVQPVRSPSGAKELCAYIVGSADERTVKKEVARKKPPYMVPAFIVKLDSIPLNVNGKVDRRALPPVTSSPREGAEPSTPTEKVLCGLFAKVIGIP